jgi:hypothetical protein
VQTADLRMFPSLYILPLLQKKDIEETFWKGANIYIKSQMIFYTKLKSSGAQYQLAVSFLWFKQRNFLLLVYKKPVDEIT